jgi:hypothetical protein
VGITNTERGRYGNAHIRSDINDGLADVVLEVIQTEEQKTERARKQKEKRDQRNMTKEEAHEIRKNTGHEATKAHERMHIRPPHKETS